MSATWSMDTSSSTAYCTNEYTGTRTGRISAKKTKQSKLSTFSSEPMQRIVEAGVITGKIVLFGSRRSPAFADYDRLHRNGIRTFYADPVVSGYDNPPRLFQYEYAVIIDAFEYIPELMGKANLIKEALATLSSSNAYIIMIAKTPEMVNELAKKEKYEVMGDGFLITNQSVLDGLTIKGIEAEELIRIAHFAGAQAAEIDKEVKTDMVCVRAYPVQ